MQIIHSVEQLKDVVESFKHQGKSVGLVPTMGALHKGHASLVSKCRAENDCAVVSVFVNPTQFNNKTDFATYPHELDKDVALLESLSVDVLFAPQPEDVYTENEMNETFSFDFQGLDKVMEGKQRPGHFNGVVQIVSKLFSFVEPDRAYFGEKDFQQVAIIKLMVRSMNFKTEIVQCPIIREESGLAASSRNQLLSVEEREIAANIYRVLKESVNFATSKSPAELTQWTIENINAVNGLEVEYYEIVDGNTLQKVSSWDDAGYIVGCVTVHCGRVRLIDNIKLKG